jgi:hypothetical protein
MTRINNNSNVSPQAIPSQDSASGQVSKSEAKTTQQPGAAEQQQNKQAATGRKSEMDLHGTIKQSELAQFRHLGGGGLSGSGGAADNPNPDAIVPDAISGAGEIAVKDRSEYTETKKQHESMKQVALQQGMEELEIRDGKEKAAKEILDTYLPKKERNSSKKGE